MIVRVPASTANIGPGFDVLGIALNLYNYFELGEEKKYKTLADRSFRKYFEYVGKDIPKYSVNIRKTEIPISRGLGSSANLIVGGLVLANEYNNRALSDLELLDLATEVEGHPDNVTPAIFGGLCVSALGEDRVYYSKKEIDNNLKFIAFIPPYQVSTEEARGVLPTSMDYKKAIENMSNTSMIISLIGDKKYGELKYFLKDNFHEPYRKALIKDYDDIKVLSKRLGAIGTYISGAGPTMMSLTLDEDFYEQIKEKFPWDIKIVELFCDNDGYTIID